MSSGLEETPKLLSVQDLSVKVPVSQRSNRSDNGAHILEEISLDLRQGESMGLTGQSGSGKSTLLRSIIGLVDSDLITSGNISFDGFELITQGNVNQPSVMQVRGSSLAFVWQNPKDMLHPMYRTDRQITEHLRIHESLTKSVAIKRAEEALKLAGVHHPSQLLRKYPHELSGGEAQRVCLAQALVTKPKLLIADEILSSLDPETSEQVVETLLALVDEGLSILFVSHNLDALARLCTFAAVLYEGKKVESGTTVQIVSNPTHHHTQALVQANQQIQGLV